MGEALALAVQNQLRVVDQLHAVGVGKLLGAAAHKVDVRTLFENQAGGLDGIAQMLDAGHAAGLHAPAIHQQGVQLNPPVRGKKAAPAGVEGGVVFQNGDGGLHGIKRRSTQRENAISGFKGVAHTGLVSSRDLGRDGPGAAVDEEGGNVNRRGRQENIVEHLACGRKISILGTVCSILEFMSKVRAGRKMVNS
jgi:hypothetical protein